MTISPKSDAPQPSTSRAPPSNSGVKMRIKCTQRRKSKSFSPRKMHRSQHAPSTSNTDTDRNTEDNEPRPSTSGKKRIFLCLNINYLI